MKYGDINSALKEPYTIVLSASASERYFKDSNPVGKLLRLKGSVEDHIYVVTGVMNDIPQNSHLSQIDVIASLTSIENNPTLHSSELYNYFLLHKSFLSEDLNFGLHHFVNNEILESGPSVKKFVYKAQPIEEIYLFSNLEDEIQAGGNPDAIYLLSIISIFILLIAWINYINLATSRSIERAKEVAVRKVSGATNLQLIRQFLTESFIVNVSCIILALIIVKICSVSFYQFFGLSDYQDIFTMDGYTISIIAGIFFIGIFLSGLYPAKMISGDKPVIALKGKFTNNINDINLRKGLVVFQFICCASLMIAVFIIYFQFKHIKGQDLKIDIENTLIVKSPANVDSTFLYQLDRFKRHLLIIQQRESISINSSDTSISKSSQLEVAIPPSKIAALSSGEFVGMVSDNPDQKIDLKVFHGEILNDHKGIREEEEGYVEIPAVRKINADMIQENYLRIKREVKGIIEGL
jgi:putative ABC transport system permease protein